MLSDSIGLVNSLLPHWHRRPCPKLPPPRIFAIAGLQFHDFFVSPPRSSGVLL